MKDSNLYKTAICPICNRKDAYFSVITLTPRCPCIDCQIKNHKEYEKYRLNLIKKKTKKKSLIDTNPYLKNPTQRAKILKQTVITSTAIEGVHIKEKELNHDN